jgi:hypothetical protein
MPTNDREVWVNIVSGNGQAPELNYLTYAIYSFEKYEWYDQMEKTKGKAPTPGEINDWISQITETRTKAWRDSAARAFDLAARTYMKDFLIQERQAAANERVVTSIQSSLDQFSRAFQNCLAELRKSNSFGKQLFVGFIIAILSPVILGLLILSIQAADLWPNATGFTRLFHPKASDTSPPTPTQSR